MPIQAQARRRVHVVTGLVTQGLNAMGELVADIIVETLQSAGVKHCYGIVSVTLNLVARSLEKSEIERNGALFDACHPAWPGRRRLGNGEGENFL